MILCEAGGSPFQGEALLFHQELDLLERVDVLGVEKPVALGVAGGFDESVEGVAPLTDGGGGFPEGLRHLAYRV